MAALLRHWVELAIGSAVICNMAIIELHRRISQGAVFGHSARNPPSPQVERLGLQFRPHESNDLGFCQAHAVFDRLKGRTVFPCHLNHKGYVTCS